jgi:hypothetical protein
VHEPAPRRSRSAALLELAVEHAMEQAMGLTAEPLHQGTPASSCGEQGADRRGLAGTLLVGGRSRTGAVLSGAALMAGSACLRFGFFEAGQDSARDPKYTVVPQRQRLERGEAVRHPGAETPAGR